MCFNDLDQELIGSCGAGDLALSVLASVIGHYPHRNQVLIDAGALALSKDISAQEFQPKVGYGTIADAPAKDMAVIACSQEHGFVGRPTTRSPTATCRSAARVRVLPNHACITRRGVRPLLRGRQRARRRQVRGRRLRRINVVARDLRPTRLAEGGSSGPLMARGMLRDGLSRPRSG
jgi:hypothetical protein